MSGKYPLLVEEENDTWCLLCLKRCGAGSWVFNTIAAAALLFLLMVGVLLLAWAFTLAQG